MALMLTAGAIVAGTQTSAQAAGAQGNPPMLRQATSSELAAIASDEAQKTAARSYRLPETARYSTAETDAYASVARGGM